MRKLFDEFALNENTAANIMPITIETATQRRKSLTFMTFVNVVSKIPLNNLSI